MPRDQIQSRLDLRSSAVDRKRDKERSKKWNPKWAVTGMPTVVIQNNKERPITRLHSQRCQIKDRQANKEHVQAKHTFRKQSAFPDESESVDSSTDEDIASHAILTMVADNDNTFYSYDAPGEPSRGSQILKLALTKAVERHEEDLTTKLIKDEYDVLDNMSESTDNDHGSVGDFEDGFELI